MNQFPKIFKFELKYFFKNKVFIGITVFLMVLIAGVMFFPRITEAFGEKEETVSDVLPVMLIKAHEETQTDVMLEIFGSVFTDYQVQLTEGDTEAVREAVLSGNAECAFVMTDPTTYTYYVNNLSMYDANAGIAAGALQKVYQMNTMIAGGMTPEQAGEVMNIQITGQVEKLGKDQAENFLYTYIMIFALYMVIILYGQMVATNVATEKSSRAMELLITSAKPTAMMFGKVLASCTAGLIQLCAIFGSSVLFYHLNKSYWVDDPTIASVFNIPPELLVYMLVFFVLGFLIYAFLYGAVSSTVSKLEDINTAVMPISFLFVIAFMVVIFSMTSGDVDNVLMVICSYVPFTSPMAMFTRIAMSVVPWYEITASIAILIASTAGIGVLSAKIYRAGVLMYGTTPKIGDILKTIRKA